MRQRPRGRGGWTRRSLRSSARAGAARRCGGARRRRRVLGCVQRRARAAGGHFYTSVGLLAARPGRAPRRRTAPTCNDGGTLSESRSARCLRRADVRRAAVCANGPTQRRATARLRVRGVAARVGVRAPPHRSRGTPRTSVDNARPLTFAASERGDQRLELLDRRRRPADRRPSSYGVGPCVTSATAAARPRASPPAARRPGGPRATSRRTAARRPRPRARRARQRAPRAAARRTARRPASAARRSRSAGRRRRPPRAARGRRRARTRAPHARHDEVPIVPWTSIRSRVPAARCRPSMFWVITASSMPAPLELDQRPVRAVRAACPRSSAKRSP